MKPWLHRLLIGGLGSVALLPVATARAEPVLTMTTRAYLDAYSEAGLTPGNDGVFYGTISIHDPGQSQRLPPVLPGASGSMIRVRNRKPISAEVGRLRRGAEKGRSADFADGRRFGGIAQVACRLPTGATRLRPGNRGIGRRGRPRLWRIYRIRTGSNGL
jgi:hypothetical protein